MYCFYLHYYVYMPFGAANIEIVSMKTQRYIGHTVRGRIRFLVPIRGSLKVRVFGIPYEGGSGPGVLQDVPT